MSTTTQQKEIVIGQKVFCVLHGGRFGLVVDVRGKQSPASCRSIMGGVGVMGGSAEFDIIWNDGTQSPRISESLLRSSVQWRVYDEVHGPEAVAEARANLAIETARRKAEDDEASRRFAEAVERLRSEHTDLVQSDKEPCGFKRAVTNVRLVLKKAFPKVKFSVRKDGYDSINIRWDDGPTQRQVEVLTNRFQGGHFDGMEDIYRHERSPWTTVFGSSKYVSASRSMSDSVVEKAIDMLWEVLPGNLREIEKPTAETVHQKYTMIPDLYDMMVSEAVRWLAWNYDASNQCFVAENVRAHKYSFVLERACERQSESIQGERNDKSL